MTDEDLRNLVAETSRVVAENSRAIREMSEESDLRWEESQRRWEESYEIDIVGHAGAERDEVYLAEIKSQLREDGIHQILKHLRRFPLAFPQHRGKKLFGILAADDFVPWSFGLRSV